MVPNHFGSIMSRRWKKSVQHWISAICPAIAKSSSAVSVSQQSDWKYLQQTAAYAKAHGAKSIRLNTNGLSDLIHSKPTAAALKGYVDTVSISLNAGTKEGYLAVTRPKFGEGAFDAMQAYAVDCKAYVPQVMLTVVDVLSPDEIAASQALAQKLDIPLRVRRYDG